MLLNLLYILSGGLFLIGLIRRFYIQYIIVVFFLPDAEIETEIEAEPAGVPFSETTGIHRTLPDGEVIFIGPENIIHAECHCQFFFKEPPVDAAVQRTKAGKLIELLLSFQPEKTIECKRRSFVQF